MKKVFAVLTVLLLFYTAVFSKNIVSDTSRHDSLVRDGSSFKKAVIIPDTTESTGVDAEYKWLALHYPGYTSDRQSLNIDDKRPYDILYIKTKEGEEKKVYFDISNYFGKW